MVVTSWELALTASTVQLLTGSPSRSTVQAPQLEVSHPQWVPVSPRVSLTKCTSNRRGSTSASSITPFTFTFIRTSIPPTRTRARLPGHRTSEEYPDQVALVLHRALCVLYGIALLSGDLPSPTVRLGPGAFPCERVFRTTRPQCSAP